MKRCVGLFALVCSASLYAMPAQVLIIRHAEKNQENFELTNQGVQRAGALASYLSAPNNPTQAGSAGLTNGPLFAFGPPFALFAARPLDESDWATVRCIQTIVPTALQLKLPIHSPYAPGEEEELASFILNEPRYEGKNILICWHHELIFPLITAFGYLAPSTGYPGSEFDLVWQLTFPAPPIIPGQSIAPIEQALLFMDTP